MGRLSQLAVQHGTDKWGHHYYTEHYENALNHLRNQHINLLEIGVGGYEYPDRGGASLRMWADYFPLGNIYGLDIYDKSGVQVQHNVKIFQGSQIDPACLNSILDQIGELHIVVDDGSHHNGHQVFSFEHLFPKLQPNGIYIIEDTETSYWPDYAGSADWEDKNTCINYFLDKVHRMHYRTNGFAAGPFEETIESIQFYNNIIIIRKGHNA
jgi:hypothetical protein